MTRTFVSLSSGALAAAGVILSTTAGCSGGFIAIGDLDGSIDPATPSSSGGPGSSSGSGSGSGSGSSSGLHGSSSGSTSSGSGGHSSSSSGAASSSSGGSSSSSGGTSSGSGGTSSSSGGGSCCPANWGLHACKYPDGGAGFACHNPQLGCASSLTCGQGCDAVVTGPCGGSSSSGGGSSSSGASSSGSGGSSSSSGGVTGLHWYMTCGAPVCRVVVDDGGPSTAPLVNDAGAPCPPLGSSCSVQGETCGDPATAACGAVEICDTQPPRLCPVSSRQFKDAIQYVDSAGLQQLHDETLGIRLATYNYKATVADPSPKHLGFIIEDRPPQSSAVDWSHERVDLYGYLSMVVATMQVQEKEIAALRRQLEEAQQGVCGR